LEIYLRCFEFDWKHQWAQWLPLAEWWYNTYYHIATHMTSFEVVYGKKKPSVISYIPRVSKFHEVEKNITVRATIVPTLKYN
jgi:hypothetical protein